jgi:hypothetical protein
MPKEVRSLNGSNHILIVNEEKEDGSILIQSIVPAPWGADHLGYTEVDRLWLEANSTLMPNGHELAEQ